MSSAITNIDNNIKNLLERAHIWDNLQHHIVTWNEHQSTTDRKLEILGKYVFKFNLK